MHYSTLPKNTNFPMCGSTHSPMVAIVTRKVALDILTAWKNTWLFQQGNLQPLLVAITPWIEITDGNVFKSRTMRWSRVLESFLTKVFVQFKKITRQELQTNF